MNKSNVERLESLFSKILSLCENFIERAQEDVLDPFYSGKFKVAQENLMKFGPKMSFENLLSIIVRNFKILTKASKDLAKHQPYSNDQEKFEISEEEIDIKFSDFLKDMQKLQRIPQ